MIDQRFPFSVGANEQGQITASSIILFQELTFQNQIGTTTFNSEFNIRIDLFGANVGEENDSQFLMWQGTINNLSNLNEDVQLLSFLQLQLSNDSLPGLKRLSPAQRGVRPFIISGDNGVLGIVELRLNIAKPRDNHGLQLTPFVEFAKTWENKNDTSNPSNSLTMGVGLRYLIDRKLEFQTGYGVDFSQIQGSNLTNSIQENGVFFRFFYRPK